MFRTLFRRRRTDDPPLLAAFAQLYTCYLDAGPRRYLPEDGRVSRLGFAAHYDSDLIGCAPPAVGAGDSSYTDKFVEIRPGEERSRLGHAELGEEYVYDERYRCDIDLTGLRLRLTLRQDAFDRYRRFIGNARVPASMADTTAWHGKLLILLPSPVFEFPRTRGSPPPYPPARTDRAKVGKLRMLQTFGFDAIDIVKIGEQADFRSARIPDVRALPPNNVLRLPPSSILRGGR